MEMPHGVEQEAAASSSKMRRPMVVDVARTMVRQRKQPPGKLRSRELAFEVIEEGS
jgi:hypothetical protein